MMVYLTEVKYLESCFHGGLVETREGSSGVGGFELRGGEVGFLPGARLRVGAPVETCQLVVQVPREENVEDEGGGERRLFQKCLI